MDWQLIIDVLILLAAAVALGTLAEQLKQSAIVGYLLAGTLVGPLMGWVDGHQQSLEVVSELGVSLLLFTLGLEFSFRRLRGLGGTVLAAGVLQLLVTALLMSIAAGLAGQSFRVSLCLGLMLALSSTAIVLRLLRDQAAMESRWGRLAVGILLLQDVAVLPVTLLVAALAGGGSTGDVLIELAKTLGGAVALVVVFVLAFLVLAPRLLNLQQWANNRELPILLAFVIAVGSSLAAHVAGISPAMGAFMAGVLMAASPFAVQVRADITPFRTVLVTLFFATVGLLVDLTYVRDHWPLVCLLAIAVIVAKAAAVFLVLRPLQIPRRTAIAAGLSLAQVGEFGFVLAGLASTKGLFDEDLQNLVVAVTTLSLLVTPYLVVLARRVATATPSGLTRLPGNPVDSDRPARVLIIGFGPAGQRVAEGLLRSHKDRLSIIDLSPRARAVTADWDLPLHVGDAASPEVLEHAGLLHAAAVVVTLPDPAATRQIIHVIRHLAPNARLIVRARYHAYMLELASAGAETVVDEENEVGRRLSIETRRALGAADVA